MSSRGKGARFLAVIAAGSLTLAACATGDGDEGSDSPQGGTITVAWEDEIGSYNNNTAAENAVKNAVVLNQVLRGFWFYGADGGVEPDPEFGTYEKTSDDPLTVKYTFHEDAVWSDGEPIDCDDFLLTWVANSGKHLTGQQDEDGNDITVFSTAGTTGYSLMQKPQCADGDKEVEVVYDETFADWQAVFGSTAIMPAHVVEEQSGVDDLVAAIEADDIAELTKAAEFYNTGWVMNPGDLDKDITPSAGPYVIDAWQANQSLTLKANENWWGTPAKTDTIVVRFIAPDQQAQALENDDVQVINPQPQVDVLNQLERIGDSVVVDGGDVYTYEHYDFNFAGIFADPELRRAFTLCVPRQTIIDNLVATVNPDAEILNSRYVFPFQPHYQDVVDAIVGDAHDAVDIAGARAVLEAKGAVGTQVRIGYNTPNQRRTDQVGLLRDSCNQAGFDIVDAGADDFFGVGLDAGNFDVAMFAWAGSPLVTGSSSTFVTNGGNNNGKYSNPQVDALVAQLDTTPDVDEQIEIIKQIETILWTDLATIPVFAHPGVAAYSTAVDGVVFQPSQTQITWNMHEWELTE